jgi:P-type Cu2+ transporter
MSCCMSAHADDLTDSAGTGLANDLRRASERIGEGLYRVRLSVPTIHCGGCVQAIETSLASLPGIEQVRVNLSTRRVTLTWRKGSDPSSVFGALAALGHEATIDEAETHDATLSNLVRSLAVAGFAASNVMMLSVAVWAGADPSTRDMFHWLSAAIALGAIAYSGRIFFRSAWNAALRGHVNMDVPISIAILLTYGMSLNETVSHQHYAYFDAAVSLLFVLLIGRTLDHMMRERARSAVTGLARLAPREALIRSPDGRSMRVRVDEVEPGMVIAVGAGERVPVDGFVLEGCSNLDCSIVSGESLPRPAMAGVRLQAGTLNLTAPLFVKATAAAKDSFIAEMVTMMEAAEAARPSRTRIADQAARIYAPAVHLVALLTFLGWFTATGDAHVAFTIAISVLIITCPCALGLAVPMVQVMASRRLFESGILLRDGGALERLSSTDMAVFDKTGTLTVGEPRLVHATSADPAILAVALAMARHSTHPNSRGLVASAGREVRLPRLALTDISDLPGSGLQAKLGSDSLRLGRPGWALDPSDIRGDAAAADLVLSENKTFLAGFSFENRLRADASLVIDDLRRLGLAIEILSGDRMDRVQAVADELGVALSAEMTPADKGVRIAQLQSEGRSVLMVGDGLNDAPALALAHVSMAPATAADIGRNSADFVFLRESLLAVSQAIRIARSTRNLVQQNLIFSLAYNCIAVPVAVLGHVTPLLAAIAMSSSSLAVVANSLRLRAEAGPLAAGSAADPGSAMLLKEQGA